MPEYLTDGDQGFVGVNMRLDPAQLSPGFLSSAKNKRFVNGVAETRPGVVLLPWSNKSGLDYEHKVYAKDDIVRYSGRKRRISGDTNTDTNVATGITNGTFATDSVWTKGTGWTISGNKAARTAVSASNLSQDMGAMVNHVYFVKFTLSDCTAGTLKLFIGEDGTNRPTFTSNGTYESIVTSAGANPNVLFFQGDNSFVGKVSNVTVSEPANVQLTATQGAVSNPLKGPYFIRNEVNSGTVKAPLASNNETNSEWTELSGQRVFSFGIVYGVGAFSDPNSIEYLIVAASDGIYVSREGMAAYKLNGLIADGPVTFVQAFHKVIMFRGEDKAPYMMSDLNIGFEVITQSETDEGLDENDITGLEPIPNADNGIYFQNRMIVPHSRDLVSASDFLNPTRYQPVLSSFRINQGSADKLVALHKYDRTTVICFKEQSIYVVRNIYGNMEDLVLDQLTSAYGCIAPDSIVSVGKDVWFLSDQRGVCSLAITQSGAIQGSDQPVSDPIQPLINKIRWDQVTNAVSAYHNNRYYLSVCLDDSSNLNNNAVLVYDFINQSWSGHDTIAVKKWVLLTVWGKKRLCYLDYNGNIGLYDDTELGGLTDETVANNIVSGTQIADQIQTRGYSINTTGRKHWHSATINVQTLNSQFNTQATVDGAKETVAVKTVTFDRTKYDKPFYAPDYDATNVNDDFNTPYRQDYSINGTFWPKTNGVFPDLHQESSHKLRLNEKGRYVQLVVNGTQGRTKVSSVVVDGLPKDKILRKEV